MSWADSFNLLAADRYTPIVLRLISPPASRTAGARLFRELFPDRIFETVRPALVGSAGKLAEEPQ